MAADLNFKVTAGGGGANDPAVGANQFSVTFPSARPNNTYYVTASTGGVAAIFGIDIAITSQKLTGFAVQLTTPLASGDVIEFHVYDPTNTTAPSGGVLVNTAIFPTACAVAAWGGVSALGRSGFFVGKPLEIRVADRRRDEGFGLRRAVASTLARRRVKAAQHAPRAATALMRTQRQRSRAHG